MKKTQGKEDAATPTRPTRRPGTVAMGATKAAWEQTRKEWMTMEEEEKAFWEEEAGCGRTAGVGG